MLFPICVIYINLKNEDEVRVRFQKHMSFILKNKFMVEFMFSLIKNMKIKYIRCISVEEQILYKK